MYFNRLRYNRLKIWKNSAERKPLILEGARQVGKTFLLKHFGETAYSDTAYFNFEEQPDLKQLFEQTKDVDSILQNLSLLHGKNVVSGDTLLILDEIQESTAALNSLKYFCENRPDIHIAAAGSLLGVTLGKECSFPVGKVDFLKLYPLTFDEFLDKADSRLAEFLNHISAVQQIPDIFFNQLVEKLKLYFISGGMPEAAETLLRTLNTEKTDQILQNIIRAYQLDFLKHAPSGEIARIIHVWDSIPAQLGKENKKFLYQKVRSGARARQYEDALLWLKQAGLIYKIQRNNKAELPLPAYDDLSAFKIYLLDTGLLRSHAKLAPSVFKTNQDIFTEFKGSLTENFILQSLLTQFDVLPRYWASNGVAEVDYLLQYENHIIPCEVKAATNIRSKSLTVYHQKYAPELRIRFSLRNLSYDDGLLNIPLFLAGHTKKLVDYIVN